MHALARRHRRSRRSCVALTTAAVGGSAYALAGVLVALLATIAWLVLVLAVRRPPPTPERAQRAAREAQLDSAGIRKQGLAAATALVDQITEADPVIAAQLELETLLDRYVALELATAKLAVLVAEKPLARVPGTSEVRTSIRERALALRRTCEARLAAGRDELTSIEELLQYLVQRSALEAIELETGAVADRLALLED